MEPDVIPFCDQQPVHWTNAIQPHGIVLVITMKEFTIVQVSENVAMVLQKAPHDLLNTALKDILTATSFSDFQNAAAKGVFKQPLPFLFRFTIENGQETYLATVHEKASCLITEIEFTNRQQPGKDSFTGVFHKLQYVHKGIDSATTVEEMGEVAAREIKRISGYDKVMIYSFDENWNGLVIAEAAEEGMDLYLGLKFPATDIPKPARDLYLTNPYRIISNVENQPVRLTPQLNPVTNALTDLSDCRLRSVMPVHLEYLKNMSVNASMSTRIIVREQLWGLIACHHRTAKYLSFEECAIFEFLSHVISARINSILVHRNSNRAKQLNTILEQLQLQLASYPDISIALSHQLEMLKQILAADGIAVCWDSEISTCGSTPQPNQVRELLDQLATADGSQLLHTTSIVSLNENAKVYASIASGLLALPIQPYQGNYILAFRQEAIEKVTWGGNPNETVFFSAGTSAYHPRNSFRVWTEMVKYTAQPWSEEELAVAGRLRNIVVEQTLKSLAGRLEQKVIERTEELRISNSELDKTHGALVHLTYVTTHNLQEGVRKIMILINQLQSKLHDTEAAKNLEQIRNTSQQMRSLILELENASRQGENRE